jgi:XisI protein
MDQVRDLTTTVQHEVEDYARGGSWKAITYPVSDMARQNYVIVAVPDFPRKYKSTIIVAARVVEDKVIIDEDITDKPLWQELVRAGIPREQIICAYAGEPIP